MASMFGNVSEDMSNMSISDDISTMNAIPFLAAAVLYRTFNITHKEYQPWIGANMRKLIRKMNKFQFIQLNVTTNLTRFDGKDFERNIYLNVCQNEPLRQELIHLLDTTSILVREFDTTSNLVCDILETQRTRCIECFGKLQRSFGWNAKHKGTIAIKYDDKNGPSIAISYKHNCTQCSCEYFHDRYQTNDGIVYEDIKQTNNVQTSSATCFTASMIDHVTNFMIQNVGIATFCEQYNEQFETEMEAIARYLEETQQTLGCRHGNQPELCKNRLNEGVLIGNMVTAIQCDLKKNAILDKELCHDYISKKESKLITSLSKGERTLDDNWFSSSDRFEVLYIKYGHELKTYKEEWLRWVPVKDGRVDQRHFAFQGDVGEKVTIARCGYPKKYYQRDIREQQGNVPDRIHSKLMCMEPPQGGNGNCTTICTCIQHTKRLKSTGCPLSKINDLCKYDLYQSKLSALRQRKGKPNQNSIKKWETKLNGMKQKDIELFNDIDRKIMSDRPRRSNHRNTMNKIRHSVRSINMDLILQQNNVDKTLLEHPEVFDMISAERENPDSWDQLNGCRKGDHVFDAEKSRYQKDDPLFKRTGGIRSWITHNEYILSLHSINGKETPTETVVDLGTMLSERVQYAERCGPIGFDMMCCCFRSMKVMINKGLLAIFLVSLLIQLLPYLHIDSFHVSTHKLWICTLTGFLHPYLDKFKNILWAFDKKRKKKNDSVAEQLWAKTNKLRFATKMKQSSFGLLLYMFRIRHNKRNTKKLLKQGFTFVPISHVTKIRDLSKTFHADDMPSERDLADDQKYQKLCIPKLII
eukprot:170479_1